MFFIGLVTCLIIWTQSSMANVLSIFSLLVFTTALWGRYYYCMLYLRTLRGWEDQVLAKGNAFAKVQGQDFDPYLFNGKSLPALLEFWELFCSKLVFTAQTSCSKTLESERGASLSASQVVPCLLCAGEAGASQGSLEPLLLLSKRLSRRPNSLKLNLSSRSSWSITELERALRVKLRWC